MSTPASGRPPYVLPLSADSPAALSALCAACAAFVRSQPELAPADLLHSAARRRRRAWRTVALGASVTELAAALDGDATDLLSGALPVPPALTSRFERELLERCRAWCEGAPVELTDLVAATNDGVAVQLPVPPLASRRLWPEPAPTAAAHSDGLPDRLAGVVAAIREHTAHEIGVDPDTVAADTTFFDMGADSLVMVNVLRKVEQAFDVKVTMRELFEEGDSPIALGTLVERRLAPAEPPAEPPAPPPVAHGPRISPDPGGGMAGGDATARQREHVEQLVASLTARTRHSKALAERFRAHLADARASIGFRDATKELLYPIAARSAAGAHFEDVDGNVYVDVTMGFGVLLFGHEPTFVRAAVAEHLARGVQLGLRGEDTGIAAELLCELTGVDRVAFATSGSEAVSAAIRIARAATGRDGLVMFHGAYHGHVDSVLVRGAGAPTYRTTPVAPGIPQHAVDDVLVLDYDDDAALEQISLHRERLAAVLVEPVQSRHPDRQPREFLARLRALTREHGILLIFDEMLTGFRPHLGGAQALFGVEADLAVYGKVLGGGLPIGAVGGRRELMAFVDGGAWRYGDASRPQRDTTFFAGTYMQHPATMAAARATLTHLREQGPQLQERLNARTDALAARLNALFAEHEYPLRVVHFGSLFRFVFAHDLELLFAHLLLEGVYVWEGRNCFLSTAHTDADVDHVVQAVASSLARLREAGWLLSRAAPPPRGEPAAPAAQVEQPAPVALAQERMWFTEQLHAGQRAYNEARAIGLDGPLDAAAFTAALNDVVRSQPTLRCRIVERDDVPWQLVHAHADVDVPVLDVAPHAEEAVVAEQIARESARHFELAHGPLWLMRLLRCGPQRHVLIMSFHHILLDTPSSRCLTRELSRCYVARMRGEVPTHVPPAYAEYARQQREALASPPVEAAVRHWQQLLTPLPAPLELPADRARPTAFSGEGASVMHQLDRALTAQLDAVSRVARVTPSMCLATAFVVALHALTGQDEIVLGSAVADQPLAFADTLGLFLNTLVLRIDLAGADTFEQALQRVRETMLDAQDHAHAPFEEVVRRVNPPRDPSRNPLFQVSIEFESEAIHDFRIPDLVATTIDAPQGKSTYDLTLFLSPREDTTLCQFEYATALFDRATIEGLAATFDAILRAALADVERPLATIAADVADADAQLAAFERGPAISRQPSPSSVREAMREHARSTPAATAIETDAGAAISYAQLEQRVALLAGVLASRGARAGSAVMLVLPQDASLVVATLAVLELGAAYVPVDVRAPTERKLSIAADCAAALLVCRDGAPWWPADVAHVELDEHGSALHDAPAPPPHHHEPPAAETPAYILYTSGSTGRPKGVVMPYAGLANLVAWHREVHPPARTLQYASPSFDVSVQEIVCTLATGGTVVTIAPETRYDSAALGRALADRRVEQLHLATTPLRHLVESLPGDSVLPDLRELLVAGEQVLLTERLRTFLRRNPQLVVTNEYGPTETHAATRHTVRVDDDVHVPIGRPVAGTTVRLLDAAGRRVARGAVGELCIAGPQVAAGYRQPAAGRRDGFVTDPHGERGARMYRTGDLARWRHDGALVFLGRTDDQVKVRGNRVEPGEVEACLRALPLVADVAVLPWTDARGEVTLAAYVVPAGDAVGDDDRRLLAELRTRLAERLPDYMIPAAWSLLTHLPTNASNKLDRHALPEPTVGDSHEAGERPTTDVESVVHDLWCAELQLQGVGSTTSFFDVGGHSLNAICIVNRINERFGVEYPILDFFRAPTVRATATAVAGLAGAPQP